MTQRKILAVFANPRGTTPLELDEERFTIERCLALSKARPFELKDCPAARIEDLQRLVLEEQPEIVHISGHGTESGLVFVNDDSRGPHDVPLEALSELLAANDVRVAVLNACYSSVHADALSRLKMPYIVAMSDEIEDESAIAFTRGFYTALAADKPVEAAFAEGVRSIIFKNATAGAIPRLWTNHHEKTKQESRPHRMKWAVAIAVVIVLVLPLLYVVVRPSMTYVGTTADDRRLKFNVSTLLPSIRVQDFKVSGIDAEVQHNVRFGKFLPRLTGTNGSLEVGIERLVADTEQLSRMGGKEIRVEAIVVEKWTRSRFRVTEEVTVDELLPFFRARRSDPELVDLPMGDS